MKIHLRLDESNVVHTRLTLFLNGASCGSLCMRTDDEVVHFLMILRHGLSRTMDSYVETGSLYTAGEEKQAKEREDISDSTGPGGMSPEAGRATAY